MDPEDQEESILDLEEGNDTNVDSGVDIIQQSDMGIGQLSIPEIIDAYMQQATYKIRVTAVNKRGTGITDKSRTFTLNELIQNDATRGFFTDATLTLYNKVTGEADINSLVELLQSANNDMQNSEDVVDRPEPGSAKGATSYSFNQKVKSNTYDINEIVSSINKTLKSDDYKATRENEEKAQEGAEVGEYIGDEYGTYRSTHPYWGYKTDRDGLVPSTVEFDEEGNPVMVDAPFAKGAEYRNFIDMDPTEIFKLQKRMVQAGMDAPTSKEYGQWGKREATFMSAIFIKATDSGKWEKDLAAGLPMYESTLAELEEIYKETSGFMDMYQEGLFLEQQAKANPGQVKDILDQVSEILDINFTAEDYMELATEINMGLATAAKSQRDYEESLITDRDIILGTEVGDASSIPQGTFPLYLPGSSLPLVIPGYDILRAEKGEIPTPMNPLDVITENLKARPDIQREMSSVDALSQIQYATNLFEASMGQIELGETT